MTGSLLFLRRMVGGSVIASIFLATQVPALAQMITLSPVQGQLWPAWSKDESQWTTLRKSTDFYGNMLARKKLAAQAILVLRNILGDIHRLQKVPPMARFKATFGMPEMLATATLALLGDKPGLEQISLGVSLTSPSGKLG